MQNLNKLIQWRAIIAGLLVGVGASDMVGDIIAKIILTSAPQNVDKTTYALSLFHNNIMLFFMLVLGSFFTFLGGFTAASFAKGYPVTQAAIVGFLSLIFSIILKEINLSIWFEIASIFITNTFIHIWWLYCCFN